MLELFGRPYVMDFVIAFTGDKLRKEFILEYVSESLRFIVNNTALGEKRVVMDKSLKDLLEPPKEETRTAVEIIDNIKQKLAELGA